MLQGHLRKGESRPALTGRAARRYEARCEARNSARASGHRILGHHERALIAAANAGHWLVRDYMRLALGCDEVFIHAYESWAGRHTAEQYRKNHGVDPDKHGRTFKNGRTVFVHRYRDDEDGLADLRNGALTYNRTRDLVTVFDSFPAGELAAV